MNTTKLEKSDFESWYSSQVKHRKSEDREQDRELEESSLTFTEAAGVLGHPHYQHIFTNTSVMAFSRNSPIRGKYLLLLQSRP